MKRLRFTEEQIIGVLREQEAGVPTAEVCRKHGISSATFYAWKAKYGGMEVSEAKRLKTLEEENAKLKRLLANAMLDKVALKDRKIFCQKNSDARRQARGCRPSCSQVRDERALGVPCEPGRPQDRSLPVATAPGRRASRPAKRTGARTAPVRLSPPARPAACRGPCWSVDFVHDQLSDGRRLRILNVIDDMTKECLAAG